MSSVAVRDAVLEFLEAESDEDVVVLDADVDELKDLLAENSIQPDAPWLGVQFVGDGEEPVGLSADNTHGKYRERGGIYFHIVAAGTIGVGDSILSRGETLRNLLRGRRIDGEVVIESMSTVNFGNGATLEFEGGYVSGTFFITYHRDLDL